EGEFIGGVLEERQAAITELRREFDNLMNQADQRLRSSDISGARERVSSARLVLNSGRSLLAEAEYENKLALIDQKISDIENQAIEIQLREAREREAMIAQKADEDRTQAQQQRQAKINEQLDRVRALMTEL